MYSDRGGGALSNAFSAYRNNAWLCLAVTTSYEPEGEVSGKVESKYQAGDKNLWGFCSLAMRHPGLKIPTTSVTHLRTLCRPLFYGERLECNKEVKSMADVSSTWRDNRASNIKFPIPELHHE